MKSGMKMLCMALILTATPAAAGENPPLATQKDSVNYAIGVNLANNLKQQGVEIDPQLVLRGMQDAFAGRELLLPDDQLRKSLKVYQTAVRQKQAALSKARQELAGKNSKAGETFLAENKTREGIVTLPSGLQYRIIREGSGQKPTGGDTVACATRGTLLNGVEFENTTGGSPAVFKVNDGVFLGRSEALKLMPVGAKWQLFIPHQLAYGERGRGNEIGPNETLLYEIELLSIK